MLVWYEEECVGHGRSGLAVSTLVCGVCGPMRRPVLVVAFYQLHLIVTTWTVSSALSQECSAEPE